MYPLSTLVYFLLYTEYSGSFFVQLGYWLVEEFLLEQLSATAIAWAGEDLAEEELMMTGN